MLMAKVLRDVRARVCLDFDDILFHVLDNILKVIDSYLHVLAAVTVSVVVHGSSSWRLCLVLTH